MKAIRAEKLSREYRGKPAIQDLTFEVEEGEVFGFLGPNGAGKTTTLRILTGQIRPTAGKAWVLGQDVVAESDSLKPLIGVVFEYQNLYERMTGRENLDFTAGLYGVSRRRVGELLEKVGLTGRDRLRVHEYSNGMRQRLLIARALLHMPRLLFLDEPTRGLDPAAARDIRRMIIEMTSEGVTVFLTTHYMEEADQLCHRVAFLNQGQIVALDTPERLKIAHGRREVVANLANGEQVIFPLDEAASSRQLAELAASGRLLTLHSAEATLEEVFLEVTGRRLE